MLGDELSDNSRPGGHDIGFLDPGVDSELGQEFPQYIGNHQGSVSPSCLGQTPPFLQKPFGRAPFRRIPTLSRRRFPCHDEIQASLLGENLAIGTMAS
jgi:hypothetical protein